MSLIADGISQMGLGCAAAVEGRLETYLAELELWNRRLNLVKATGDELVVKHLLDSLAGVRIIEDLPHATIADIGSGAGLPGIPLALFIPDAEFLLVERSSRRAAFLRNAIALLDLRDRVRVVEHDLDGLATQSSIVTFRAFRELTAFAPSLFAATEPRGAVVAYKGRRSTVEQEMATIEEIVDSWRMYPVSVPWLDEERTIVVIHPRR